MITVQHHDLDIPKIRQKNKVKNIKYQPDIKQLKLMDYKMKKKKKRHFGNFV